MTRNVFDNSMTAHVWAQQNQSSGRSNNGNISFDGRKLYSYSTVIGIIMPGNIPLYTTTNYSITTSGHMRDLKNAIGYSRGTGIPSLDSIAGDLDSLAVYGKKLANYSKQNLMRYLAKHAAVWTTEATSESRLFFPVWLLRQLGERNPESKWRTLHAKAAKAKAEEIARGQRRLRDERLAVAKKAAATTPAMVADWKAKALLEYSPLSQVQHMALSLHHARGAAKAKGWKVIAKKTAALLKEVRAFADYIREREGGIYRNRIKRQLIVNLRSLLQPDTFARLHSEGIARLSRDLETLTTLPGLQPKQRANIARFRAELDSRVPEMKANEDRRRTVESQVNHLDQILRRRAREMAEEQRRADWFAGVPAARWNGRDEHGNAYMRVVGDTLETSQGAQVPLAHAVRVFRFVKYHRELNLDNPNRSGTAWKRNGHSVRVGHFTVDFVRIDGGFTAGCHNFAWPEIERVAQQAGVYDLPASNDAVERT